MRQCACAVHRSTPRDVSDRCSRPRIVEVCTELDGSVHGIEAAYNGNSGCCPSLAMTVRLVKVKTMHDM